MALRRTGSPADRSLTVTVTVYDVAVVGVPEMTPVLLLMLKPVGRPLAL